jgi:hypothetical protein
MPDRVGSREHDPTGKRALFEAPVMAPPDVFTPGRTPDGKAALFSIGDPRPGTVVVGCSSCTARTRISVLDLGVRIAQLGMFLPTRRKHQYLLRCPACDERRWCNVSWTR